jgi:hypothetical protein
LQQIKILVCHFARFRRIAACRGFQCVMLNNAERLRPEIASAVSFAGTDILNFVATLKVGAAHRAIDDNLRAVFNVHNMHGRISFGKADPCAKPKVIKNLQGWHKEIAQFEIAITGEGVVAGLLERHIVKSDAGFIQFGVNRHSCYLLVCREKVAQLNFLARFQLWRRIALLISCASIS